MVGAVDVRPRAKLRLFVVVLAFVDVKTRRCHRSTRPSCKTFHTPSKAIRLLIFSNHLPRFMGYCKTSFLHILMYIPPICYFRGQSMNTYRHQKHKTLFFPHHILDLFRFANRPMFSKKNSGRRLTGLLQLIYASQADWSEFWKNASYFLLCQVKLWQPDRI